MEDGKVKAGLLDMRPSRRMSDYRNLVIETYWNPGEPSRKAIRARPVPGQGFSKKLNVECSSQMREDHPVGTKFIVSCKITSKEDGTPFLYTSYKWDYEVVTDKEAAMFIKANR